MRALTPACPPGQAFLAFVLVVSGGVVLLACGVPGATLATTLLAVAVLVVVLTGGGVFRSDAFFPTIARRIAATAPPQVSSDGASA